MQSLFGIGQSVPGLVLWGEPHVTTVVHKLTVWLSEIPAAPDTPGVH